MYGTPEQPTSEIETARELREQDKPKFENSHLPVAFSTSHPGMREHTHKHVLHFVFFFQPSPITLSSRSVACPAGPTTRCKMGLYHGHGSSVHGWQQQQRVTACQRRLFVLDFAPDSHPNRTNAIPSPPDHVKRLQPRRRRRRRRVRLRFCSFERSSQQCRWPCGDRRGWPRQQWRRRQNAASGGLWELSSFLVARVGDGGRGG